MAKLGKMVRFSLKKYTPYLDLTGEPWGVFCELYEKKWPQIIESTLCVTFPYFIYQLKEYLSGL